MTTPAALVNGDLIFKVDFHLENSPKDLTFSDYTDYSLHGHGAETIKGLLKIVGPSGIAYQNAGYATDVFTSPDYTGLGSAGYATLRKSAIALPLDSVTGLPEIGTYTFYLKIQRSGSATVLTTSKSYNYTYVAALPVLTVTSDCRVSTLTATDDTEYAVGGIDPQTATRLMSVVFPLGSGQSTQTTALDTLTVGPNIWTGDFNVSVSTALVYDMELWGTWNWFTIVDTVIGETVHEVVCEICTCALYNCLAAVQTRYETARGTNLVEADRLLRQWTTLTGAWMLYRWAMQCGLDASVWCDKIVSVLAAENCTCTTSTTNVPEEVIPWASITPGGGSSCCQWHSGNGTPSGSLGSNDDFYLDTTAPHNVYKKISGTWTLLFAIDGAQWYSASGVPSAALGQNDDLYLDTDAPHNTYKKTAGAWVLIGQLDGTDGTTVQILGNLLDTTYTDTSSSEKVFDVGAGDTASKKQYTLVNVPTPVLGANGDCLRVFAVFKLAVKTFSTGIYLRVYMGSSLIGECLVTGTVTAKTQTVTIECEVNRTIANNQFTLTNVVRSGDPGTIEDSPYTTLTTESMAANVNIEARYQNLETIPALADAYCYQLKVEKHPM
jgi:hypothetical protein